MKFKELFEAEEYTIKTINMKNRRLSTTDTGTFKELLQGFRLELELGQSRHEKDDNPRKKKVNVKPKNIDELMQELNIAGVNNDKGNYFKLVK